MLQKLQKLTALGILMFFATIITMGQHIGTGPSYHTIAAKSDGTVYTWGANWYGQLGNGNTTDSNVPVAVVTSGVLSGKTITQVAAGAYHSIALASDGTVYTWGINSYGELGNGNTTDSNVPVAVSTSGVLSGKTITKIAAGYYHSIVLASDGTVYTWGYNGEGELGNNSITDSNVPVAVSTSGVLSGKTITQVAAGYYHSIALASDGVVYTWGYNNWGQSGNGNNTQSNVPVAVTTTGALLNKTITQVAAGAYHSIVLASDGIVYTWGANWYGQLGNGNTTDSYVPVAVITSGVLSGKTITQVAAGHHHSIALTSDGTVYTWGNNGEGELGNGNTGTNSNVPVAVNQSGMGALPVELTSFSANILTNGVELNWQTATEVNNYGFEVERTVGNGQPAVCSWEKMGFIEGHGNSNSPKNYTFEDKEVSQGKYVYRLKQLDNDGKYEYSKEIEVDVSTPLDFSLEQNFPNPFNPETVIKYALPFDSKVVLKVYNTLGQEVALLKDEIISAGNYEVNFNASHLSSGIYFYSISAQPVNGGEGFRSVKKLVLVK